MSKLKLTVNEEKTRICRVPDGEFDFLGYTFGRMYSPETGKARLGYRPAGRAGVAERLAVPLKPGNAGGGKGPQFKTDATSGEGPGDWET